MATKTIEVSLYGGTEKVIFYPDSHRYKHSDGEWLIGVTSATGMLDKSGALVPWAVNLACDFLLDVKSTGKAVMDHHIEEARKQHQIRKVREADVGTMIHEWAEQFALAKAAGAEGPKLPEVTDCFSEEQHAKVIAGILAFLSWYEENDVRIVEAEQIVFSRVHRYVGTMDLMFTMGTEDHKVLHFGDYKTGGGIYDDMLYQESAYKKARLEEVSWCRERNLEYPDHFNLEIGDDLIIRFAKEDKHDKEGNLKEEAGTVELRSIRPEDSDKNFNCFLGLLACKRREKELKDEWRKNNS